MNLLVYVILQIYVGKKMWNGFLEMKFLVQINLKNNFRIIGTDLFLNIITSLGKIVQIYKNSSSKQNKNCSDLPPSRNHHFFYIR